MDRIAHNLVTLWMVATTAHLPFPVCDGDDTGSIAGPHASVAGPADRFDIDFVLLGCDAPDDPDDGPVDHDPESGTFAGDPFPVFIGSASSRTRRHGKGAVVAPLATAAPMQRCDWCFAHIADVLIPVAPRICGHPEAPLVMRC
ncbi:hypothetical protein Mal4_09940 [Maioricimonas rarisocia]|uniref:Uncharacterized protein n=1 Tax=Maioricimonas rarisocia TaxID=2528026 RepID=A0A517Z2L9_9PLAN|nr:hypothetical protein [Maioricimonas rarisocia]QDU36705.1 hypothetical protein Mal4_09940 [Maioricimonas rarisocia]